jgi:hypothetical protein
VFIVNDEFGEGRNKEALACFKALPQQTTPGTEESHEEPYLGDIIPIWDFPKIKLEC